MSDFLKRVLGINWKTTGLGLIAFLGSVPSLVTAINNWAHHQPADWRVAALGIVTGLIGWVAKDGSTHSTVAQIQLSTLENPKIQTKAIIEAKEEARVMPSGVPIVQPVPQTKPEVPK